MTPPLYARLLGSRWDILPAPLRLVHSPAPRLDLSGQVKVDGAGNAPARLVRWILGFPQPGEERPISVVIETTKRGERWTRSIGDRQFSSELSLARKEELLQERFGPLIFTMTLPSDERGLGMIFAGWRLGPLPLPAFLAPRIGAREFVDDRGRFNFDVALALPLIGRIVAYRGWLELAVTKASK
jgi:hypothetical protein